MTEPVHLDNAAAMARLNAGLAARGLAEVPAGPVEDLSLIHI